MSDVVIQLSANTQPEPMVTAVLELGDTATAEFFDQTQPSFGGNRIQLNYMDGLNHQDASAEHAIVGEFSCVSNACVSDSGLFESVASIASVDPGLLASSETLPVMDTMNMAPGLQSLNADFLNGLPKLKLALNGVLGYDELSQLIQDVKAQILELNAISQDLFGDLSAELEVAVSDAEAKETASLFDSMQSDCLVFSDHALGGVDNSLALGATLDGLFTSPEAFPLTLDFSNPHGIQEASELFALASSGSSISSAALEIDADNALTGQIPGSSDFS